MIGSNVDSTSTLIIWIDGALALSFTPYLLPCLIISGFSSFISASVGVAIPYPVCLTVLSALLIWSYSLLVSLKTWNKYNKSALLLISIFIISFNTWLYNPSGADKLMVTSPVDGSISDKYALSIYSLSLK